MPGSKPKPTMRFVLPPSMHAIAWLSVVFYGTACAASAVSAVISNVADDRFAGWFCFIGFGCFFMMSVYFLASCRRHVLLLGPDEVVDRGAIRTKGMESSRIASAQWRPIRSRCHSVVLRDGGRRMVIQFRIYGSWNYLRLVQAVREAMPASATQTGWSDDFIKPLPPPNAAHSFRRIFRFTCVASGIGWLAMMAVWLWLRRIEPQTPELWNLVFGSTLACAFFPGLIAFQWWLDTLDKRAANNEINSGAPAARAADDAVR